MKLPQKLELTWNEKQTRWFKKIPVPLVAKFGRKQFMISQRDCSLPDKQWTKEKSYFVALEVWKKAVAEVEAESVPVVPTLVRIATGEIVRIEDAEAINTAINRAVDIGKLDAVGKVKMVSAIRSNQDAIRQPATPEADRSFKFHVEAFRTKCRNQVGNGEIKAGRFGKIDNSLDWLLKFAEDTQIDLVDSVRADLLESYFGWLNKKYKVEKVLACATIRDHWQVFHKWVEWLFENDVCPLPKNYHNKKFSIVCPKVKYRYWTREEFEAVYATTNDRLRLYLLLVANCGFYSSDIASLKKKEINLKAGTITRQRQKTGDDLDLDKYAPASNVPVVTYHLWPETLKLLKANLSNDPIFALTNEDGGVKPG